MMKRTRLDGFHSASILQQQSTDRHVAAHLYIIMFLHTYTLSCFWVNQSLLLLFNAVCWDKILTDAVSISFDIFLQMLAHS